MKQRTSRWTPAAFVLTALFFLLPAHAAWGDDVASVVGMDEDEYYPERTHFIQFGLDNTVTLAWAHPFMDDRYLRYGIDLYVLGSDYERESNDEDNSYYEDNSDVSDLSFDIHIDYLIPLEPHKRVRLYLAMGPSLGFRYRISESREYNSDYDIRQWSEYERTRWFVGGRLLAGAEFAITSHASLFLEAGAEARVRRSESTTIQDYDYYDGVAGSKSVDRYTTGEVRLTHLRYGLTFRF